MDCNIIDLDRTEQAVSSLLTINNQQGYQPRTLQQHNYGRFTYLPLFPTISFGPKNCLLLANVPITRLAPHEILRRQHGALTSDALTMMNNYGYSNYELFTLSEQDANELATRLRVHMSIITFNATQFRGICYQLLLYHESFRRKVLHKRDVALKEPPFYSKYMAIALEFYLQIDVDIFFMKTCSFRGAKPCINSEGGLFCGEDEPKAQYTMVPCENLFCSCCYPRNNWSKSQPWPVVNFASSSMHQFVNGYTTYLNCPAACNTPNVIYAMTCPCGHYDYVDSTAETLGDAMAYHREHGNRIIHEKLTGSPLNQRSTYHPNQREKQIVNEMRLYQHSARCPSALRSFLDCNPIYWCFIPMFWPEAEEENLSFIRRASTNADAEQINVVMMSATVDQRVASYLASVPITPAAYAFSYEQRQQQRSFFQQFLGSSIQQLPYSTLDLYQMAIIAVLPDDRSTILRYIIQTLFSIHAETKLNMICPLGGDPKKRYGRPYDLVWCKNLNRRSRTSTTSN